MKEGLSDNTAFAILKDKQGLRHFPFGLGNTLLFLAQVCHIPSSSFTLSGY
ncbi:MAG: hypothetical protein WD426_18970 [Anditalea sp.]